MEIKKVPLRLDGRALVTPPKGNTLEMKPKRKEQEDLVRLSDGTFRVPDAWKTPPLSKESRKKLTSSLNSLRWAVEELEKKNDPAYRQMLRAHRGTVKELWACLDADSTRRGVRS